MNSKILNKSIMFFSLLIVGAFVMFSFQSKGINTNTSEKIIKVSHNNAIDKQTVKANAFNDKCGAGKCGHAKKVEKAKAMKCGEGKCGKAMKNVAKERGFMSKDTDGDNKVSKAEFLAAAMKEFPLKDKNNDGKISKDECPMFSKIYSGDNDFMTKDEFVTAHEKMFEKLDKNKNGFISQNESKMMHSKCGEGKCGEGKCGSGKCGSGKCGDGKSGSMKASGNNTVDESELKHSCSGKKAKSCCKKGKSCSKSQKTSCKH